MSGIFDVSPLPYKGYERQLHLISPHNKAILTKDRLSLTVWSEVIRLEVEMRPQEARRSAVTGRWLEWLLPGSPSSLQAGRSISCNSPLQPSHSAQTGESEGGDNNVISCWMKEKQRSVLLGVYCWQIPQYFLVDYYCCWKYFLDWFWSFPKKLNSIHLFILFYIFIDISLFLSCSL